MFSARDSLDVSICNANVICILEWNLTNMAAVESSQNLQKHDRRFFLTSVKRSTGNVAVLREQYLREDLSCHSPWCRECPDTSSKCAYCVCMDAAMCVLGK